MSRISLYIKAYLFRMLQTIGRYCDLYLSPPFPQRVSFTRKIPSTVGHIPGTINLLFYHPPSYLTKPTPPTQHPKKFSILINFHGGGYTIGNAADDARWATSVVQQTSAVVISVGYRLAPSHPFPTGISDCVSAILYIWQHAEELNLDPSLTALSGFSAGGNFTYTVCYRLHEELARLKRVDMSNCGGGEIGKIVALASFYPSCDSTKSWDERGASNVNYTPAIPAVMVGLFEKSYLYPGLDLSCPLLSPGLASDELVMNTLPKNMVLITCRGDGLLMEAETFRERLKGLGKRVEGYIVEGVAHGWDKWPSWGRANVRRDEAYRSAAESLKRFWKEAASSSL